MKRKLHCRIRAVHVNRRLFLGLSAAGLASAQTPAPAPMPPPAKAKITSAVMLWTLPAPTFEERVKVAARAGLQSVCLRDEYLAWNAAELQHAKRFVESFGMSVQTVAARTGNAADMTRAIAAAKQLEAPYVILGLSHESNSNSLESIKQAIALAAAADVVILIGSETLAESVRTVRDLDSPHVRLLFNVFDQQQRGAANLSRDLKEALDVTEMVSIADAPERSEPGTGTLDWKDIYRTLQRGGYSHIVAMEYKPKGDAVASLKRAVDGFRAVVNERGATGAATEGSLV